MIDGLPEFALAIFCLLVSVFCLLVSVFWLMTSNEPAGIGYIIAAAGWGCAAFKELSNGEA